jgi:hypothetical protein
MVQQFPKELMAPALHIIQYSMLSLKDLANTIAETMQKRLFVGAELYGRKENDVFACKITKVLEEGPDKIQYEVAWLDKNKKVMEHSLVSREDLIQKKAPFSRNVLKSFIRDSTYRSAPWVIHDKLARNHGISTDLPEELRSQVIFKDGLLVRNMEGKNKRKKIDGERFDGSTMERTKKGDDQQMKEPIKYPIDDLLVQPGADDPIFTDRPSPSRDFNVPLDCVGDLLMVWDFCSSFGRLLQLSPFSLEDFENAICHKDSNQILLLVETHSALLRLLIKDNGEYLLALGKRNKKLKITLINWTEYLCDFLEMIKLPEFTYTATIKRGHYGLLDAHAKLGILRELINQAIQTDIFREKLDSVIEEQQELGATRRGEAIEEARKKREEKEHLKAEADANGVMDQQFLGSVESVAANDNHSKQNGHIEKKRNGKVQQGNALENWF